jgi:4-aminobutyrate--pyruvate transaminase
MSSSPRGEAEGAPLLHAFNKAYPRSPPKVHVRGEGDIYVVEKDGTRLLDGLAGLWSVNLGYNQPRLVAAATQQMSSLPYYHNFWNQGHDRAYELAGRLADFIPFPIEKVRFRPHACKQASMHADTQ